MMKLNLCTDAWIPIQKKDGIQCRLGLYSLFEQSEEIVDLVMAPHERIAVMRLLICIIQRALNGPEDEEEREECKGDIVPKSLAYLHYWESSFELFGNNGAFLQFANLSPEKEGDYSPVSKLNMGKASGNNPTVFDHGDPTGLPPDAAQVALDLLTFQNFSVGGTIGVAVWNGLKTAPKSPDSAAAAPCICSSAVHLFLKADTLLETLALNLIPFNRICSALQGVGIPVWEKMPTSIHDADAVTNATLTYLGRLVPTSRCVYLLPDLSGCIIAKGLDYPFYSKESTEKKGKEKNRLIYYESSMTVYTSPKDSEQSLVRGDVNHSLWRNLPTLLHRFHSHYQLPHLFDNELPKHFDIWVGALVADKAKLVDAVEDSYTNLSPDSVQELCCKKMQHLLQRANVGTGCLKRAIKTYTASLTGMTDSMAGLSDCAEATFWQLLTDSKLKLISLATNIAQAHSEEEATALSAEWYKLVSLAAKNAYNHVTAKSTPRQLQAWSAALNELPTLHKLQQ